MILSHEAATSACEDTAKTLKENFPGFLVSIIVTKILGDIVKVLIANVPNVASAPNGIIHNATLHIGGLIQDDRKGTCYMENPVYSGPGLKFRKISGKDESEVLAKFSLWLLKNKDTVLAIAPRFNTR